MARPAMGGDLHIRIAKLAFHAKESPIQTRDEASDGSVEVWWDGEACAAAQPAAGRREQAVPPALV